MSTKFSNGAKHPVPVSRKEVAALAQRETEELKKRLVQLQQQLDDRGGLELQIGAR
jgi:hypothetical protein